MNFYFIIIIRYLGTVFKTTIFGKHSHDDPFKHVRLRRESWREKYAQPGCYAYFLKGVRVIRFVLLKSIRGTDANIQLNAIIGMRNKVAAQNTPP